MSEEPGPYRPLDEPQGSRPAEMPSDYDMNDSEEDFRRWPNLAPVLRDCRATIGMAYHEADSAAMRYQARHRWVVLVAAVCGMLAVLFAITQLYFWALQEPLMEYGKLLVWAEIVAAVVAVVAIVLGLRAAFSKKWLLERQKAEGYRLLKFRFLTSRELWSGATSRERRDRLRAQMESLEALDEEALERWAKGEDEVLEKVSPRAPAGVDKPELTDLIDYYQEKRLNYQRKYCDRQAERRNLWERLTKVAPLSLFFLSILAALGHFVYDLWTGTHGQPVSLTLIMLAACLPVVGVAIRTLRMAHEFGRNALRFRATSNELEQLARELRTKSTPWERLEVLYVVEEVLEVERREWLRLMMEAEWFG
jgi:hypothetical protein